MPLSLSRLINYLGPPIPSLRSNFYVKRWLILHLPHHNMSIFILVCLFLLPYTVGDSFVVKQFGIVCNIRMYATNFH